MTTPIRAKPRATRAQAKVWLVKQNPKRLPEALVYVDTMWDKAPQSGYDPTVLLAQAGVETGDARNGQPFQDIRWERDLNPAGMGATDGGEQAYLRARDGRHAALAQLIHMIGYVQGAAGIGDFTVTDNPRWPALMGSGMAGTVTNVEDLGSGKWATQVSSIYSRNILANMQEIAADLAEETSMAVKFEKRVAKNRLADFTAKLRDAEGAFTVHENGNTNSSPYDEAGFVNNGGGSEAVLYHFTVGVENGQPIIVQIFPADRRGKHAGNVEGNATSLAVEVCQAPPGATGDMTQEALEELLYMVYTHDSRIDWGAGGHTFSPANTLPHAGWRGANPGCPATMLKQWGGINRPIDRVKARLATGGGGQPTPTGPEALLPRLFGVVGVYKFNPTGPITTVWLAVGKENGLFPRLEEVIEHTASTRDFVFRNGLVIRWDGTSASRVFDPR